jgi:plastocyanin
MKTVKSGICLVLLGLLLNSCTSGPEKYVPKVYHVEIKDMKFDPAELIVNKGDTVVWTNDDMTVHDVTDEVNNSWTSKPIASGKSWKMAITKNESYYCSIHKVMKGTVSIE